MENAKVVQGSSHVVAGLTEILVVLKPQISDKNIPITFLLEIPKKNYSKILIQELC